MVAFVDEEYSTCAGSTLSQLIFTQNTIMCRFGGCGSFGGGLMAGISVRQQSLLPSAVVGPLVLLSIHSIPPQGIPAGNIVSIYYFLHITSLHSYPSPITLRSAQARILTIALFMFCTFPSGPAYQSPSCAHFSQGHSCSNFFVKTSRKAVPPLLIPVDKDYHVPKEAIPRIALMKPMS